MGIKGLRAPPPTYRQDSADFPFQSIYGEIGPGERIALSKLAIEKFEETGRPLRIAIDISIWQFQIQSGQGGSNPAIRTFYYRLLRLLSVSVQPLFVFDGSNKPPFKRGKKSGHHGASIPNLMCKQLLKLFGFPFHTAPGEAEAECAYLQREGIVDAVLSEDVDTLMFGCGTTLRNWSSESSKGKTPTHVSLYDSKATREGKSGLDREGMILVALMSGGDYITEGIPGCGIKVACEAARAGFGKSLCKLLRSDTAGLDEWRRSLSHELRTNESKYFRIKHKTLTIPDHFPNKEVLGYYTHPVVSSPTKIEKLKEEIAWDGEIDIPGIRLFVAEAFDWTHKGGARKFIRGMAPALLIHKLRLRGNRRDSGYGDVILTAMNEMELVRAICGQRKHFSTDGAPELRVIYHPNDIVGLDLDAEEDDSEDYGRDGLAPVNDDDQIEAYLSDESARRSRSPTKRAVSVYDPTQPDKLWILETIAKVGIPLKVEDYEESLRNPIKFLKAKAIAKKAATKGGMPQGAMDKYIKVSKIGVEDEGLGGASKSLRKITASSQPALPQAYVAPTLEPMSRPASTRASRARTLAQTSKNEGASISTAKLPGKSKGKKNPQQKPASANANPWSIAKSSPSSHHLPTLTKPRSQGDKIRSTESIRQPQFFMLDSNSSQSLSVLPLSPTSRKRLQSPRGKTTHEEATTDITPRKAPSKAAQLPLTPTSDEKHVDASPRKKRTPISAPRSSTPPHSSAHGGAAYAFHEPVNRKLDFLSADQMRSPSSSLPAMLDPSSPASPEHVEREVITISSSPEVPREAFINTSPRRRLPIKAATQPTEVKERGKYIMLRDSLPGGWKEVSESQLRKGKGRAWRTSQVAVLDLTEA